MIADKSRRGRPKRSTNKNKRLPPSTASTSTPSDPSSSREIPRLDLQATVTVALEGSTTTCPPSRDKSHSVYRLALGLAGIAISKGFVTCHPKLPESVKGLLEPIPCIPQSVRERVSSTLKASLISLVPHAVFKSERRILLCWQASISWGRASRGNRVSLSSAGWRHVWAINSWDDRDIVGVIYQGQTFYAIVWPHGEDEEVVFCLQSRS